MSLVKVSWLITLHNNYNSIDNNLLLWKPNAIVMIHTELVWKVARYTSAGPIYFSSMDNYVDGGILANNPSASGLTEIQDFYRRRGQKLPISLIVSIGGGRPPSNIDLGDVNAHEYLSLGKHWLNFKEHFFERLGNSTTLLGCAVSICSSQLQVKKKNNIILSHLLSPPDGWIWKHCW